MAANAEEMIEELHIELADDEVHDWIRATWEAATEAAEARFTTHNNRMPNKQQINRRNRSRKSKVKINEIRCPKCKDRKIFIARDGVLKTCYEC